MDLILEITKNRNAWDEFINSSPQGSIFSDSRYLLALEHPHTCYFVRNRHGENLAGVVIVEDGFAMSKAPFPFTPYQGIMFSPAVHQLPSHKKITTEFKITDFIIVNLITKYNNFNMALSPSFDDIRAFQWHNYHLESGPRFEITTRTTAVLNILGLDATTYLSNIRSVRRQECNKSTAEISEFNDVDEFIKLYVKMFERQGIIISNDAIKLIRKICTAALTANFGRMTRAVVGNSTASISVFLFDAKHAYYLFAANNPEFRNSGASSKLMLHNILHFLKLGLSKIDFIGVNSPNRGDFKISFGPSLSHYYEVSLIDHRILD